MPEILNVIRNIVSRKKEVELLRLSVVTSNKIDDNRASFRVLPSFAEISNKISRLFQQLHRSSFRQKGSFLGNSPFLSSVRLFPNRVEGVHLLTAVLRDSWKFEKACFTPARKATLPASAPNARVLFLFIQIHKDLKAPTDSSSLERKWNL